MFFQTNCFLSISKIWDNITLKFIIKGYLLLPENTVNRAFSPNSLDFNQLTKEASELDDWLNQGFQCDQVLLREQIQSLWSGYGEIVKFQLLPDKTEPDLVFSVIAKWVKAPLQVNHPRGWQSDRAHNRKLTSYQVELNTYKLLNQLKALTYSPLSVRVPYCFYGFHQETQQQQILLLEDLDHAGFPVRYSQLTPQQTLPCLQWLAEFHAYFLCDTNKPNLLAEHLASALDLDNLTSYTQNLSHPLGVWPIGSYWHLATRSDEWQAMADSRLKKHAAKLDKALNQLRFQTLIHGDAKVANFCFSKPDMNGEVEVAALDFQYTGQGCGMKDLAYFLGSCLTEAQCEQECLALLDQYFVYLKTALLQLNSTLDVSALEAEWRFAFELAWADFQRFLEGWSPNHKKNTAFSRALTVSALNKLGSMPI